MNAHCQENLVLLDLTLSKQQKAEKLGNWEVRWQSHSFEIELFKWEN